MMSVENDKARETLERAADVYFERFGEYLDVAANVGGRHVTEEMANKLLENVKTTKVKLVSRLNEVLY